MGGTVPPDLGVCAPRVGETVPPQLGDSAPTVWGTVPTGGGGEMSPQIWGRMVTLTMLLTDIGDTVNVTSKLIPLVTHEIYVGYYVYCTVHHCDI